jgi:hypothetical protein
VAGWVGVAGVSAELGAHIQRSEDRFFQVDKLKGALQMVALGAKHVESEDDIQGNARPLPGRYHVVVKDVNETFEKFDKVIIEFEVLAGTTPGQEGRVVTEFFATSEKALSRLQRLAIVLGLLKPGEEEKEIEFSDAISTQLVIEVEENQYEKDGKTIKTVRVAYLGMWSLNNKAVGDVPKDGEAAKLAEGNGKKELVEATATGGDSDKWADL